MVVVVVVVPPPEAVVVVVVVVVVVAPPPEAVPVPTMVDGKHRMRLRVEACCGRPVGLRDEEVQWKGGRTLWVLCIKA